MKIKRVSRKTFYQHTKNYNFIVIFGMVEKRYSVDVSPIFTFVFTIADNHFLFYSAHKKAAPQCAARV